MKRPLLPIPTGKWGQRKIQEEKDGIEGHIDTLTHAGGGQVARYKFFRQGLKLRALKRKKYQELKNTLATTSLKDLIGKKI